MKQSEDLELKTVSTNLSLAIMILVVGGCATQSHKTPRDTWETVEFVSSEGYDTSHLARLDTVLENLNTQSLIVVSRGRVLYSYGDVSDTGYVASVRKSILAVLLGPYVESGDIDLDATLADLGIDDHNGLLAVERRARIRDLISARSGVYHPAANGGDSVADAPPRGSQEPGTYFLYNNWDFNAAGGIFEKQTGLSVYQALKQHLADPLQFEDFDFDYQELHGDASKSRFLAYHMFLSARDLARIGLLMLRDGRWNGAQLVSRDWLRQITSEVTDASNMNPASQRQAGFDFGYMWWRIDDKIAQPVYKDAYFAQGSYGQFLLVVPTLNLVIAHKTRYRRVESKRQYDEIAVSWAQFKDIADIIVGAQLP